MHSIQLMLHLCKNAAISHKCMLDILFDSRLILAKFTACKHDSPHITSLFEAQSLQLHPGQKEHYGTRQLGPDSSIIAHAWCIHIGPV